MKRWLVRGAVLSVVVVLSVLAWHGFALYRSWNRVERVTFDPAAARLELNTGGRSPAPVAPPVREQVDLAADAEEGAVPEEVSTPPTSVVQSPPAVVETPPAVLENPPLETAGAPEAEPVDEAVAPNSQPTPVDTSTQPLTFLIVGDDARANKPGSNADVIALFQLGDDTSDPLLISLPRDLQVADPCTGEPSKLALTLSGCGDVASGPEALALAVEDLTAMRVDHFVLMRLDGFRKVVDLLGGIEICVPNDVRFFNEGEAHLSAGCSLANGPVAEWWMRARAPQEYVDDAWRPIQPVGDSGRNRRQQELLVTFMGRLRSLSSIGDLRALVDSLAEAFVFDDGLTLGAAVELAWDLRGLDAATIRRPTVSVSPGVSADGTYLVTLDAPIGEILAQSP